MEPKLLIYDKNIKWSEVYDHNNKLNDNEFSEYDSDVDETEDNKELKIHINNDVNFSIDNENILKKINSIIHNEMKLSDINSIDILKDQDLIMSYLCKYIIQHNFSDFDFFIKLLEWIYSSSDHLSNRINLKQLNHNLTGINNGYIPRSSYKFCNFKDSCLYNYDNKNDGCYADHYVHNMVAADIEVLIKYLKINYSDKKNYNKEIIKCINTISFVIRHMSDELTNICYYCKDKNFEKYHKNRHIISKDYTKKNNNQKRNKVNNIKHRKNNIL